VDELVHQARLSDAGIAGQANRSAAEGAALCGASQQRQFARTIDELRYATRLAHPPAGEIAGAGDAIYRHRIGETLEQFGTQGFELDVSFGQFLAGLGCVDLAGLRRRLQPGRQVLRGSADLVDLGEFAGDHVGHDQSGVEAYPNLKPGIAQTGDAPYQRNGGMAGERRVIVIRHGRPKDGREAVAHFLADDAAKLTDGAAHGGQRRFKARQGLLGIEFGDEARRMDQIRAENRHELPFAVGILALLRRCTAMGTPIVSRIHRRSACETMHFHALFGRRYLTPAGNRFKPTGRL
jgi:hypothetical protein